MTPNRRRFLLGAASTSAAVAAASVGKAAMAALPEPVLQTKPDTMPPLVPDTGRPYNPVVTLNGWTLPWRMNAGVKEFHLVAEPVVREMAPGLEAHLWGYNGQSPGPTIEVVEGDRVRIFVTNRLPEHTSIHWHGQRLPNGMDGVVGLNQQGIEAGKTFVYEFVARRPGTFMYHPHADEMVQMAMGMMGFWVTHPKGKHPLIDEVNRDFVFLLNNYDIEPGSATPKIMTMLEFNLFNFNSRIFPGIDSMNVRKGDKVRIRVGNLTMTNHPMHVHGHEMFVTGTDGGPTPKGSRWPEVSVDIAVGQMRQLEFLADEEGDWAFHCHKSHHTMNAMGHDVPTMIGVDHRGLARQITGLVPDYMVMSERGMADMAEMEMPLPDNTAPMMSGAGPYGSVEMGGMFTVVKVRPDQQAGDYTDPGWYRQPRHAGLRMDRRAARPGALRGRRRAVDAGREPAGAGGRSQGAQTDWPFEPLTMKGACNMDIRIRAAACAAMFAIAGAATAADDIKASPYAGQQQRPIKALSAQEVSGLLAGHGAGMAKAAELNGYPGPLHTLELERPLGLSAEQANATAALMKSHRARAAELGLALVEAERRLDALFSGQQADAATVDAATARIGTLQARLRAEHLKTHLAQTALLTAEQVRRYAVLRGYSGDAGHPPAHGKGHHR